MRQIQDFRTKEKQTEFFCKALTSDELAPDILRALKGGETIENIVEWLPSRQQDERNGYSPAASHQSNPGVSDQEDHQPRLSWTEVTRDTPALDHLFRLYFSWVHPVSTLFGQNEFTEAFHRKRTDYCSSLLVNAMCALACSFRSNYDSDGVDYDQLESKFTAAFRENFDPLDKSITTIQAVAIMFLVEMSKGSGRAALYLKMAVNSITELSARDKLSTSGRVLRITAQGIRCLTVEWAQVTHDCPASVSTRSLEYLARSADSEELIAQLDRTPWYLYTQENVEPHSQESLIATVNREKMKLINIIDHVCAMMYGRGQSSITAEDILQAYTRFEAWSENLPECISGDERSHVLPHVISLL